MTKRWSSVKSDLVSTKREASKRARREGQMALSAEAHAARNPKCDRCELSDAMCILCECPRPAPMAEGER